MKRLCVTVAILLGLYSARISAQDIHFSQFYETSVLRNPSLIGIYSEDYKITGQYRNQWASVGKGYRTGLLSAEIRFPINHVNDFLSIGLLGFSDKAGRIDFKTVGFYPAINYNKSMEDEHNSYLSVGFTAGYLSRSIDISKMSFDNQYQNGNYDPTLGNGEQQLPESKITNWDLGAGISLNSSPNEKTSYYIGISGYHFTKPKQSFYSSNDIIRLQPRLTANGGFSYLADDSYSLLFHGNYMMQGTYKEIIVGGLVKYYRSGYNKPIFGLSGGVFYRVNDAVIPVLKVDWKGQTFSFSYDVNTSTLKDATQMKGGFEITVVKNGFIHAGPEDKRLCPRL
jgi:type IX secretion system PorP/SprF family membrane protein